MCIPMGIRETTGQVTFPSIAIEETSGLRHGWEVNVNFRFFVLDQTRDMYLTVEGNPLINIFYIKNLLVNLLQLSILNLSIVNFPEIIEFSQYRAMI